jgi:glycosyltransferase involved in cell wall biosynthesis
MTADTVGGVWTYALDLSRTLAQYGCEITLASMGGLPSAAEARNAARIPRLQLYESSYKLEWMEDPWGDVGESGEWLMEIAQKHRPDLVHLNTYAHGALPWQAPVLTVGHSCVLSWHEAVRHEPPPAEWSRYHQTVRRGLVASDLVVAPTGAMLNALQTHYGPLPATQVIHNGRNPRLFRPERGAAKQPMILAVGRLWDEAKNISALDSVAGEVAWPIYVAGEDQHPTGGQAQFGRVRTLGKLPPRELASWMAKAAIYAFPARYEPFGLSVLEAALSGCALVLGDIDSLRELWGNAALFVAPDDTQALASALQQLTADGALRTQMAQAARRRAQQYTLSAMGAAYWQAYQSLLVDAALGARAAVHMGSPAAVRPAAIYQPSTQLGR